MYQPNQNFERIMSRMLARIPNGIDKREGSIIWNAIAPVALEIESLYYALDGSMQESYAVSSSREFLLLRGIERGMRPYPATKAIVKGKFNVEVNQGIRFKYKNIIYRVLEVIDNTEHTYKLECEELGEIGNVEEGDLIQVDFVNGLTTSKIVEVLVRGKETEGTEEFRTRYFESFEEQSFGGNIADYTEKTLAIEGVGAVKVTPVWNGGGTVKLTLLDSNFNKATTELISTVQNKIDPNQNAKGLGLAPVGHIVTVDTVTEVEVTIGVRATFLGTMTFEEKVEQFKEVINKYFEELKKKWKEENVVIRPAHITSRLLNLNNVEDITELRINNSTNKLTLTDYQVPKLVGVVKL